VVRILKEGDPAPSFELSDGEGKVWRLEDMKGTKVILFFYPADDTPGCTKEACDFRDSIGSLEAAGYTVFGVSPQEADSHQAFSKKFGLNFPLLVDADLAAAKAYEVHGQRGEWEGIPLVVKRSTFIIDEDGRIEHALYGVHARGHVDEIKQLIGVAA
jgi:peroxiredoxin Q/BCP